MHRYPASTGIVLIGVWLMAIAAWSPRDAWADAPEEAVAVADAYLDARKTDDFAAAYRALTPEARTTALRSAAQLCVRLTDLQVEWVASLDAEVAPFDIAVPEGEDIDAVADAFGEAAVAADDGEALYAALGAFFEANTANRQEVTAYRIGRHHADGDEARVGARVTIDGESQPATIAVRKVDGRWGVAGMTLAPYREPEGLGTDRLARYITIGLGVLVVMVLLVVMSRRRGRTSKRPT